MLIVDDILTFPFKSILWIFREITNAVQQEFASDADAITEALRVLYMMLETGQISEEEFDEQEEELLDRLDALQAETDDAEEVDEESEND